MPKYAANFWANNITELGSVLGSGTNKWDLNKEQGPGNAGKDELTRLLKIAKGNASALGSAGATKGTCTRCGAAGHMTFQCHNHIRTLDKSKGATEVTPTQDTKKRPRDDSESDDEVLLPVGEEWEEFEAKLEGRPFKKKKQKTSASSGSASSSSSSSSSSSEDRKKRKKHKKSKKGKKSKKSKKESKNGKKKDKKKKHKKEK